MTELIFSDLSNDVCSDIVIPNQLTGPLFVVVPSQSHSTNSDCVCYIILYPNTECYSLNLCSCASNTLFAHSLYIICDPSNTNLQVCFRNMSENANNTRIHFFLQLPLTDCTQDRREQFRYYIKAIQLVIAGED